jgi:two-component system chemotaxis response regulator CheB
MPPGYTRALADRLDKLSAIAVREAAEGDRLVPGQVLIAPSGRQLSFRSGPGGATIQLADTCPTPSYYSPCIDYTFQEAARVFHHRVLGVVMTGMGSDGAHGLQAIQAAGGEGWAQDEATSVIYGMPRAAFEAGAVDTVFPLGELAGRLAAAAQPRDRASI